MLKPIRLYILSFPVLVLTILWSLNLQAQTPLAKALSNHDTTTALALIKAGENPNQMDGEASLLARYCRYSTVDTMALFLLRNGAKPDTLRSTSGRTVLHIAAAYYACEALCGAILEAGADVNARTNNGATPLMLAAGSAKLRLIKFLVEKGAKPGLKDNAGKTALDYAMNASDLNDSPDFKKQMETICGFDKSGAITYLKDKVK